MFDLSIECPHCYVYISTHHSACAHGFSDKNIVAIFLCPHCGGTIICDMAVEKGEVQGLPVADICNGEYILPVTVGAEYVRAVYPEKEIQYVHPWLPEQLKQLLTDAIRCARAGMFWQAVVGCRKALECSFDMKGARGWNLKEKILYLAEKKELPCVIESFSHLVREIGNSGAHDANNENFAKSAGSVIELTKIVLEYLHVLPLRLEALKNSPSQ